MATSKEFHDYILENLQKVGSVFTRKMMGEYCVYYQEKLIGDICDNRLFLKPVESVLRLMPEAERAYPYEGSKTRMVVVEDVENQPLMEKVLNEMVKELPEPKKKKRSTAKEGSSTAQKGEKKKLLIIINGRGGVGKDTLCDFAAAHYRVRNVSSITPIKEIAAANGWKGEKTPKARKFLADLKEVFTQYNDLPTNYLLGQYQEFLAGDEQIMFAHIREGKEIDKLKNQIGQGCITLLVRRSCGGQEKWGNVADDEVENYQYDCTYDNSLPLKETEENFLIFLAELLSKFCDNPADRSANC